MIGAWKDSWSQVFDPTRSSTRDQHFWCVRKWSLRRVNQSYYPWSLIHTHESFFLFLSHQACIYRHPLALGIELIESGWEEEDWKNPGLYEWRRRPRMKLVEKCPCGLPSQIKAWLSFGGYRSDWSQNSRTKIHSLEQFFNSSKNK